MGETPEGLFCGALEGKHHYSYTGFSKSRYRELSANYVHGRLVWETQCNQEEMAVQSCSFPKAISYPMLSSPRIPLIELK